MIRRSQTQAATTSAVSWEIFEGDHFDCSAITIAFGTATTTAENLTVTLDSHLGAGSDVVLVTIDPLGADELMIRNIPGMVEGDKLLVEYTNSDGSSITGAAITELSDRDYEPEVTAAGIEVYLDGIKQNTAELADHHFGKRVIKTATYVNTTGAPVVFTVTGDVLVRIIAICKTNMASAIGCNAELGITGDTDTILATTDITTMAAGEIWHDATSDADIEAASVIKEFLISTGADIILTLSAQADSGVMQYTCWWTPVSADGNVVAA